MEHPQTPPLQRHPSLQPFSRDHYVGLQQSQRLVKGATLDAEHRRTTVATFLEIWDREIDDHFAEEERLLLPLVQSADAERLQQEHRELRRCVASTRDEQNQTAPDPEAMRALGQMLNDHIRWEERHLFPTIQDTTDSDVLEAIGRETQALEARHRQCRTRTQ